MSDGRGAAALSRRPSCLPGRHGRYGEVSRMLQRGLRGLHAAHRADRPGRGVPRCLGEPQTVRHQPSRSPRPSAPVSPEDLKLVLLGRDRPLQAARQAGLAEPPSRSPRLQGPRSRARRLRGSALTTSWSSCTHAGLGAVGRRPPDRREARPLRDRHRRRPRQDRAGAPRPARRVGRQGPSCTSSPGRSDDRAGRTGPAGEVGQPRGDLRRGRARPRRSSGSRSCGWPTRSAAGSGRTACTVVP